VRAVFNSSPLITLAKLGYIDVAVSLFDEAIALAKETDSIVVLDDLKARKAARLEGIRVIGTLGILKILLDGGLIEEKPDELLSKLNNIGFRIRPELFYEVMGGELS
jgi:predicted nucleic acid-binding protein